MASRSSFPDTRSWLRSLRMSSLGDRSIQPPDPADTPDRAFLTWLEQAVDAGVAEPQVAVLSTADADGVPDARVLILRDVGPEGWWFSGPVTSPKGIQLESVPYGALTFYWRELGRQVRIRGAVHSDAGSVAAQDFLDRSETARAVASASRQSETLTGDDEYGAAVAAADPDLVPAHWRAWNVVPSTVEFWQADPGRRHLRWRYQRAGTDAPWSFDELWP